MIQSDDLTSYVLQLQDSEKVSDNFILRFFLFLPIFDGVIMVRHPILVDIGGVAGIHHD